ncbi:hypothetical protein SASPL_128870 [Salvia splendens]|uniref:UspA domain-containing protein n=1 Tax=Salvia splendens TaxID=180675 RepID=A0A8X8ZN69_SALSN|nr:hypothetical protein SASPL_128870 [Salvia splendens]
METLMEEEEEEYNWREVVLPSLILVVPETGERRRGRHIMIVVDHGPKSLNNKIVYDMTQGLMEKLAAEAFEVAMVKTKARIVEGDAGKVICKEAERLKPAAVVMGTGGQSLIQRCRGEICAVMDHKQDEQVKDRQKHAYGDCTSSRFDLRNEKDQSQDFYKSNYSFRKKSLSPSDGAERIIEILKITRSQVQPLPFSTWLENEGDIGALLRSQSGELLCKP